MNAIDKQKMKQFLDKLETLHLVGKLNLPEGIHSELRGLKEVVSGEGGVQIKSNQVDDIETLKAVIRGLKDENEGLKQRLEKAPMESESKSVSIGELSWGELSELSGET